MELGRSSSNLGGILEKNYDKEAREGARQKGQRGGLEKGAKERNWGRGQQ